MIWWADIKGFNGAYSVSSTGIVKSNDRKVLNRNVKGKILSVEKDKRGYNRVGLCKNSKVKYYSIHRLVAKAFIDNNKDLPQVNHIDENKDNNCIENLEWCGNRYNSNYGTRGRRIGDKHKIPVIQLSMDGEFIKKYDFMGQANKYGFKYNRIGECCSGKRISHGGYKWIKASEYESRK